MRKSTRIVKRIFALLLVVLMSINTFGAVVSDNDGSAFITKAEFDSLKNNFQAQIDQYNTSIDNKIDGAIASYLAGISVSKTQTLPNNYDKIVNNSQKTIIWSSSTSYSYSPNKPIPAMVFEYALQHVKTQYKLYTERPGSNQIMLYGQVNNGNFVCNDEILLDATFEQRHNYIYWGTFPTAASYAPAGNQNDPSDPAACAVLSLQNPSGSSAYLYTVGNSEHARTITSYYLYRFSYTNYNELRLAPWSTSYAYCFVNNNTEIFAPVKRESYYSFSASEWIGGIQDDRTDTSVQNVDPTTLTLRNPYLVKLWDLEASSFPWMQKQFRMNEIIYETIAQYTSENNPIKYGLKLCDIEAKGKVKVKMKALDRGFGIFHVGNPLAYPPQTANNTDATNKIYSTAILNANQSETIEFDVEKNDKVWFFFNPTTDSGIGKCEIEEIIETIEA